MRRIHKGQKGWRQSQLRAPLSALAPASPAPSQDTRTAHLYKHVEVCVALLFLRSVAGWLACARRWSWSPRTEGGWQRFSLCPNPRVWCVGSEIYLANLQGTRAFCLISYLSLASLRPMTDIIGPAAAASPAWSRRLGGGRACRRWAARGRSRGPGWRWW